MLEQLKDELFKAGFPFDSDVDLSNLIKECGSSFIELAQGQNVDGTTWSAEAYPVGTIETGNTPEEAVAKLFISLNKK